MISEDGVIDSIKEYETDGFGNVYNLEHPMDAEQGHSGGPIFGWFEDEGPKVVGVLSGGNDSRNLGSGGPGLTNLIDHVKAQEAQLRREANALRGKHL